MKMQTPETEAVRALLLGYANDVLQTRLTPFEGAAALTTVYHDLDELARLLQGVCSLHTQLQDEWEDAPALERDLVVEADSLRRSLEP